MRTAAAMTTATTSITSWLRLRSTPFFHRTPCCRSVREPPRASGRGARGAAAAPGAHRHGALGAARLAASMQSLRSLRLHARTMKPWNGSWPRKHKTTSLSPPPVQRPSTTRVRRRAPLTATLRLLGALLGDDAPPAARTTHAAPVYAPAFAPALRKQSYAHAFTWGGLGRRPIPFKRHSSDWRCRPGQPHF